MLFESAKTKRLSRLAVVGLVRTTLNASVTQAPLASSQRAGAAL